MQTPVVLLPVSAVVDTGQYSHRLTITALPTEQLHHLSPKDDCSPEDLATIYAVDDLRGGYNDNGIKFDFAGKKFFIHRNRLDSCNPLILDGSLIGIHISASQYSGIAYFNSSVDDHCDVLIDRSGSVLYSGKALTKFGVASELACLSANTFLARTSLEDYSSSPGKVRRGHIVLRSEGEKIVMKELTSKDEWKDLGSCHGLIIECGSACIRAIDPETAKVVAVESLNALGPDIEKTFYSYLGGLAPSAVCFNGRIRLRRWNNALGHEETLQFEMSINPLVEGSDASIPSETQSMPASTTVTTVPSDTAPKSP